VEKKSFVSKFRFRPFIISAGTMSAIAALTVVPTFAAGQPGTSQDAPYSTVTLSENGGAPETLNCYWRSWDEAKVDISFSQGDQVILPGNHGWLLCGRNAGSDEGGSS
jgi:hypothetical protein